MKKSSALLALLTLFFLSAYFDEAFAAQKTTKQRKQSVKKRVLRVIELQSIEPLKEAFQKERGKVRLVTILSPT